MEHSSTAGIDYLSHLSTLSSFNNTGFFFGGKDGVPMLSVHTPDATALGVTFSNAASYPLAIIPTGVSSFMSSLVDTEEEVFKDNAIEVKRLEGELLHRDTVIHAWSVLVSNARTRLLAMPDKLTPSIVGKTDYAEVRDIIKDEVYEALSELAEKGLDYSDC